MGNTLEVYKHDLFLFKAWAAWAKTYGNVFKWFWGPQPVIAVRGACCGLAVQQYSSNPGARACNHPLPLLPPQMLSWRG